MLGIIFVQVLGEITGVQWKFAITENMHMRTNYRRATLSISQHFSYSYSEY